MTSNPNAWQGFFDADAPCYMQNCFVTNTLAEVDFIIQHLAIPRHGRVLDVGCGTGRHAVELAKRGYRVTGFDVRTVSGGTAGNWRLTGFDPDEFELMVLAWKRG